MKTLKWLWWVALVIIGFQALRAVVGAYNGVYSFDAESFVGMVLTFALLSVVLFVFWIIGRAKEKITGKLAERNNLDQQQ